MIEAMKAADELKKENIHVRVMDPFTLKPVDKAAIIKHAKAVGGKILTVEDHYVEGNIVGSWKLLQQILQKLSPSEYVSVLFISGSSGLVCILHEHFHFHANVINFT